VITHAENLRAPSCCPGAWAASGAVVGSVFPDQFEVSSWHLRDTVGSRHCPSAADLICGSTCQNGAIDAVTQDPANELGKKRGSRVADLEDLLAARALYGPVSTERLQAKQLGCRERSVIPMERANSRTRLSGDRP